MSEQLHEIVEILLERVCQYSYRQRALEDAHEKTREELEATAKALAIMAKDRDHWRESRKQAIQAGELMQSEIETLRAQVATGDNAELERLRLDVIKLRTLNDGLLESSKRLREFVGKVRNANDLYSRGKFSFLDAICCYGSAIDELDTANHAPVTEPKDGAE